MKTRIAFAALAIAALALTGCQNNKTAAADSKSSKTASMSVINTKCPYSGNPVKEGVTADYNGAKVGFCCNGCQSKFAALDDAGKKAVMAKAPK